ncbi:hypothetical protein AtNW77_Chr5g0143591 [Arabidopsis thaliana]|uniref:Transmembrane protein n=1 Tax=Arabidopsis thaliana TaxID=3702 RepID=Q8LEI5_ARATH|nr:unknown [Arabidopsis thaliana]
MMIIIIIIMIFMIIMMIVSLFQLFLSSPLHHGCTFERVTISRRRRFLGH